MNLCSVSVSDEFCLMNDVHDIWMISAVEDFLCTDEDEGPEDEDQPDRNQHR